MNGLAKLNLRSIIICLLIRRIQRAFAALEAPSEQDVNAFRSFCTAQLSDRQTD